jgi:hypothetical protein
LLVLLLDFRLDRMAGAVRSKTSKIRFDIALACTKSL